MNLFYTVLSNVAGILVGAIAITVLIMILVFLGSVLKAMVLGD